MDKPIIDLRNIEYANLRQTVRDLIPTRTPYWVGFNDSDPGMVMIDTFLAIADMFAYMMDKRTNELFLERALNSQSIIDLGIPFDYRLTRVTSARLKIQVAKNPVYISDLSDFSIPALTQFSIVGGLTYVIKDEVDITEEILTSHDSVSLYAGGDVGDENVLSSDGRQVWVDGPGYLEIDAYEGSLVKQSFVSNGARQQTFSLSGRNIASNFVSVSVDGDPWEEETFVPASMASLLRTKRYFINVSTIGVCSLYFDADKYDFPATGSVIEIAYLTSNGISGEINVNTLEQVATSGDPAVITDGDLNSFLSFTNLNPSFGSVLVEDASGIKGKLPRYFSTGWRAVSPEDYEQLTLSYEGVFSAKAIKREIRLVSINGIDVNRFVIDIYIVPPVLDAEKDAYGQTSYNLLVETFLDSFTNIGIKPKVYDGAAVPSFFSVAVIAEHGYVNAQVRLDVIAALRAMLAQGSRAIGSDLYVDEVYKVISAVKGVRNYTLNRMSKEYDSHAGPNHIIMDAELGQYPIYGDVEDYNSDDHITVSGGVR